MKVRMTKNLGRRDADQIEAGQEACQEGCCVNLEDAAANWLIGKGYAVAVAEEKPKADPESIEAVPNEPVAAKPDETTKGVSGAPKKKTRTNN